MQILAIGMDKYKFRIGVLDDDRDLLLFTIDDFLFEWECSSARVT